MVTRTVLFVLAIVAILRMKIDVRRIRVGATYSLLPGLLPNEYIQLSLGSLIALQQLRTTLPRCYVQCTRQLYCRRTTLRGCMHFPFSTKLHSILTFYLFLRRARSETGYRCCDDPGDALWARAKSTASSPPVIPCHSFPPSTEASMLSASGSAFWSVPVVGSPALHCT